MRSLSIPFKMGPWDRQPYLLTDSNCSASTIIMSNQTKKLNVLYRGHRTTLDYWASGQGYSTSLYQMKTTIRRIYGCISPELYCFYNCHMHELKTDKDLDRALTFYSKGPTVTIHAFDSRPFISTWNVVPVRDTPSDSTSIIWDKCYHKRTGCSIVPSYESSKSPVHKICGSCYRKLDLRYKMYWKKTSAYLSNIKVPSAPLDRDIHSIHRLQIILVHLGYLKKSDMIGSYEEVVSKTEEGVAKFRRKYHIYGRDMLEYDLRTAHKLASVLQKPRKNKK